MSPYVRTSFDLQVDTMLPFNQLIIIKWSIYVCVSPGQSPFLLHSLRGIDPPSVPAPPDFIKLAAVNYSTL